jgi:hypothetical protein
MEPPQREPKTYKAYKHCLELFAQTCRKTYLQEVQREDLLHFIRKLYELGCGLRTAYNRAVIVFGAEASDCWQFISVPSSSGITV